MRLRRRARESEWNDLEQCLHLAADLGDDDKLLRALARNVVYLAQPSTGAKPGSVQIFKNDERPRLVPLEPGVDGRHYAIACTSFRALAEFYNDPNATWTMVPAGILADELPPDTPVLLNGEGQGVVMEPEDMRVVALLFAGANVMQAISVGPATQARVMTPTADPPGCADPLRRIGSEHPEVREIRWLGAQIDEPDGREWWAFGVEFEEGVDEKPFLREAVEVVGAATDHFATFQSLGPGRPTDGIAEWFPRTGWVIYQHERVELQGIRSDEP
jgi:hypothetical protein